MWKKLKVRKIKKEIKEREGEDISEMGTDTDSGKKEEREREHTAPARGPGTTGCWVGDSTVVTCLSYVSAGSGSASQLSLKDNTGTDIHSNDLESFRRGSIMPASLCSGRQIIHPRKGYHQNCAAG